MMVDDATRCHPKPRRYLHLGRSSVPSMKRRRH